MKPYRNIKRNLQTIAEAVYGGAVPAIPSYIESPETLDNFATLPTELRRSVANLKDKNKRSINCF